MGLAIDKEQFSEQEFAHFEQQLHKNLAALETLLRRKDFGVGETTLGAELEFDLVDINGRPLTVNRSVLSEHVDSRLQLELTRFNLELNLSPVDAAGNPFGALKKEMEQALQALTPEVHRHDGRIVTIGILPTLQAADLQRSALTDLPRYRALSSGLRRNRRGPFRVQIDGDEPLDQECNDVTLEGANTSFQLHLRVNPSEFAEIFNAAQLVTPLAVAVSANSPVFLEHCLWAETRVALFKQAVDARSPDTGNWRRAARVPFGHGWVREGAFELFSEAVHLFPPILPVCDDQDPITAVDAGEIPRLAELRLHQGTVWQWNRPVYDPANGGHLRIELRSLPSGPTPIDMMANAAFLLGLCIGVRRNIEKLLPAFPFRYADYNFYRASQDGLESKLLWPVSDGISPAEFEAGELISQHLPVALEGLLEIGVDETEADELLSVISARVESRMTGSRWQREMLNRYEQQGCNRSVALAKMLARYRACSDSGIPVHEWPTSL